MLKRTIFMAFSLAMGAHATNITTLLDTLEKRPEYTLDLLDVQKSALGKEAVVDKLLPQLNLYGGYEASSVPTGMIPVPPNTLIGMVKDQSVGQPFSKHIFREGVSFTWPIFVKSLYTLKEKARLLHMAAKDKQRLSLIQREAAVVGAVAQLRYLESFKNALNAKKRSIIQTQRTTRIKVKAGRAPQSALFVLNSHINDLDIAMNTVDQNINLITSKIETFTGVHLTHSIPLRTKASIKKGEIFALKPLEKRVKARKRGVKAAREAYYPTIVTKGSYTLSQADAYNNDKGLHESYGTAGIYVNMPLFDASKSTASEQAKVAYLREKTTLDQTAHALKTEAKQIEREITLLETSVSLAHKSVKEQQRLLKIAKVSLQNGTITEEEYLRYEDALADAKANAYKAISKLWQDRAQLAVIYGNDLRSIVK